MVISYGKYKKKLWWHFSFVRGGGYRGDTYRGNPESEGVWEKWCMFACDNNAERGWKEE